jgi:hypothetical protein
MKTIQSPSVSRTGTAISAESIVLMAICIVDLASTMWLLAAGLATEGNPLMAHLLSHSPLLFCTVKMGTVTCLVVVTEWYKRSNPAFARNVLRVAIVLYLVLYVTLVFAINLA